MFPGENDGAGNENNNGGGAAGDTQKPIVDVVARADHERALADLQKFKREAAELKKERETLNTNKMKEQNQWKELAEKHEKEANDAREEAAKIRDSFLGERKFSTVKEKCLVLGLRPEAASDLEMLDLESVTLETTSTGKINVLGADKFAERLKTLKPHWFADKNAPAVNTNGARIVDSNGDITPAMILAAEKEGRKSGDMGKYQDLFKKFQQQRATPKR